MDERFHRLARLASNQYGLCSAAQLRECGYTRAAVQHLLARGLLERVTAGVFRLAGPALPWQGQIRAEQLSVGDRAVVSGRSAACLYGLEGFDHGRVVHLTVPAQCRPRPRPDVVFHRARDYDLVGRRWAQRVPVTSVPRLILDLCATEGNVAIPRRALHSARKRKLVTWGALDECLRGHARHGRPGIETFRWLLTRFSGKGSPESGFEDQLFERILAAGLPEPVIQYRTISGGRRRRIDLVYPAHRLLIECKGMRDHFTEEAFHGDPVRENELNIEGWTVLVFTWLEFDTAPGRVIDQIRRALKASDHLTNRSNAAS
jgi:very-short-patch-repair endonuclease